MTESAKKITQIGTPEQDFEQKEPEFPWLRQKNEPAGWFLRFQIYKNLGVERTLRAAVAMEPETEKATKGDKKNLSKKI